MVMSSKAKYLLLLNMMEFLWYVGIYAIHKQRLIEAVLKKRILMVNLNRWKSMGTVFAYCDLSYKSAGNYP